MYSAYLLFAFIFGRTLVVESTGFTITQIATGTSETEIGFTATAGDFNTNTEIRVFDKDADTSSATKLTEVAVTVAGVTELATTGAKLVAGTAYDFWVYDTAAEGGKYLSEKKGPFATKPKAPDVTFSSAGSTSATYKWTNYKTDYETDKASAVLDPAVETFIAKAEELELTGLEASTKYTITFTGEKFSQTNTVQKILCTAPSQLTVTNEVKAEDNGDNTLTVNIEFGDKDKVSNIEIELGVDISEAGITAECDQKTCKDCEACPSAPTKNVAKTGFVLTTTNADVGPNYSVIISKYPKENLESAFKVTAKFEDSCDNSGTVDNLNSFATLANKETMLVYLAIGSMATVLRLLGLEVWTPLGSH